MFGPRDGYFRPLILGLVVSIVGLALLVVGILGDRAYVASFPGCNTGGYGGASCSSPTGTGIGLAIVLAVLVGWILLPAGVIAGGLIVFGRWLARRP